MKIAIDIDEVLAQYLKSFIRFSNFNFGSEVSYENIDNIRWARVFGLSDDEFHARLGKFRASSDFDLIDPVPGSFEGVSKLSKDGHELYIVTSRHEEIIGKTKKWVDKYFPGIFKEIIYAHPWGGLGKMVPKSAVCKEIGVELFIDDSDVFVTEVWEAGIRSMILSRPWNINIKLPEGIIRAESWDDIYTKVRDIVF